jgi:hypothetical protein
MKCQTITVKIKSKKCRNYNECEMRIGEKVVYRWINPHDQMMEHGYCSPGYHIATEAMTNHLK